MNKRIVVITGGGGAIGSALSIAFAKQENYVVIAGRSEETGAIIVNKIKELGFEAKYIKLDLTIDDEVVRFFKTVENEVGPVEVLINNAGTNYSADERLPFDAFVEKKHDIIMNIDLFGLISCCRAVLPYMIKRKHGKILNISSVCGIVSLRNQAAFVGAKAAVNGLTRALALDYAQHNIQVNCLAPGSIMFEGTKALFYSDPVKAEKMLSHIPAGRPGLPEDVTEAALFLTSNNAPYVTGQVLAADGGWIAGFTRSFTY